MPKFVEAIVRTTTTERAFIEYNDDDTIAMYETRDLNSRESIEIIEILEESKI